MKQRKKISGWGNYPVVQADFSQPANQTNMLQFVLEHPEITLRGNGKSYGDAAIGHQVLSTLSLSRILDFSPETGILECESGVLLSDLLKTIVPAGWFFQVTPGIKNITVGGAIAADVHGKNHLHKGCFSNWLISMELMLDTGAVLTCSRHENPALFWQTCGGMGWTGLVLSAKFQLMRLQSTQIRQRSVRCRNLEEIFSTFERAEQADYAAGWIDTTGSGNTFGRGAVHLGAHESKPSALTWQPKKTINIPFFAPSWTLNAWSIRAFNAAYFYKNKTRDFTVDMDAFFYPLDSLRNWNRLYGRRGFVQYQCCLPQANSFDGIQQIMETVQNSRQTPFLSVLKRHGAKPAEAVNSFPIAGYSLALDFPRTPGIFDLVKELDAIVWRLGGKIYLAKDSCSGAHMSRVNPADFGGGKFTSLLRKRITG